VSHAGLACALCPGTLLWVKHDDVLARIAWGIVGDPGDSRITAWFDHEGCVAALERLRGGDGPAALARYLSGVCGGEEVSAHQVSLWRGYSSAKREHASYATQCELGISVLTSDDLLWPPSLNDLGPYAPHTLWLRGDPATLGAPTGWLGVVGSRQATDQGLLATRQVVAQAVGMSWGIVSGGATGIDRMAHQHALSLGAPTTAVLAGGLDSFYPSSNRALLLRIAAVFALVAEVPCTVTPRPERFLHRNRLIAALADAVVVTEAASRSGAMNTASHATALGRMVGVVPGRWGDANTEGCFRIARERGATVLTEASDLSLLASPRVESP